MRPISVCMPVAVTTARALPAVTRQPEKTMFTRSPTGASSSVRTSASFSAGSDSPVSEDSSTARPVASMRRASAGTRSPVLRRTTSPGTTAEVSTSVRAPSRSTRQVGLLRSRSASSARSAPRSCVTARMTFMAITARMTTGST